METGNLISDITDGKIKSVAFGGDVNEIGISVKKFRDAYYNKEINPKTQECYGYRIKTDDGSIFGSEINDARKANGFKPV